MPTIYVSNSTANGYAVGNDSNTYAQMQSKSTPALTVTGALAKAVAGDAIIINDGTYVEANFLNVTVGNLTINPQNALMVTIQITGSAYYNRILYQQAAGTGLTVGAIVLDAGGYGFYCFQQAGSNTQNLTFNGTHFINYLEGGIYATNAGNVTLSGNWLISSTYSHNASVYGINITTTLAGTVSITNGTFNVSTPNVSTYVDLYCALLVGSVANSNLVFQNVSLTYGAYYQKAEIIGIKAYGFTTYDIGKNTFTETTVQASGGNYEGVYIPNSQFTTTKCWVYNNTFNGGNPTPTANASGHHICIGDDSDASVTYPNSINGIWVYGNTCSNMNHQILIGWQNNGVVYGNWCKNGAIGVIGKHTTNCKFTGNVLVDHSTAPCYPKFGGAGDVYANNTIIQTKNVPANATAFMSSNGSAGPLFANNLVIMDGVSIPCVNYLDTSTGTQQNNNYFAMNGGSVNTFTYQGTNLTMAQWQSGHEATLTNVDPKFLDYVNADYRTDPTGPMYHAGVNVGPQNVDYRGRPFNVKPTIGAYEHSSRDPALTRTAATNRLAS